MSKADEFRRLALTLPGHKYKLGEEPWFVAGAEQTSDPMDGDCSGIGWGLFKKVGVLQNGKPVPRLTADDYWRRSTPVTGPTQIGDAAYFPRTGRKTHVVWYIGHGQVIEAGNHGPGGSYPGSGYMGLCTVAQINARSPVWGRLPGLDIGSLTEEDDMTPEQVRKIIGEYMADRKEEVHATDEIKAAEAHLIRLGLLQRGRAPERLLTWGLFVLLLSRVLKLLGR